MTGQELIDYITKNCEPMNEVYISGIDGKLQSITSVDDTYKYDRFDQDFDRPITLIQVLPE
jgi:hypothetical protein